MADEKDPDRPDDPPAPPEPEKRASAAPDPASSDSAGAEDASISSHAALPDSGIQAGAGPEPGLSTAEAPPLEPETPERIAETLAPAEQKRAPPAPAWTPDAVWEVASPGFGTGLYAATATAADSGAETKTGNAENVQPEDAHGQREASTAAPLETEEAALEQQSTGHAATAPETGGAVAIEPPEDQATTEVFETEPPDSKPDEPPRAIDAPSPEIALLDVNTNAAATEVELEAPAPEAVPAIIPSEIAAIDDASEQEGDESAPNAKPESEAPLYQDEGAALGTPPPEFPTHEQPRLMLEAGGPSELEPGLETTLAESDGAAAEPPAPEYDVVEATAEPLSPPSEPEPLPPNYFRAAGDPEEQAEPPPTFWRRLRRDASASAQSARDFAARRAVNLSGGARAVGGAALRQLRDVKPPRNVREAAVWGGWVAAGVVSLLVGFFVFVTWDMPSPDDLWEARSGQSITFLDRNGNVILREGAQNAPPVALESLPPYVVQAFIAIEDRRFYDHWGIDLEGMMRAGAQNLRAGRVVQGGSTITQQLAKNLFLTNERSWRRKAQEIAMAIWLETRFTKEEILALYLSRVYFGAGAYGIEAAAERYFDRPARQLTLLQAAMIAGLVKAPSRLNPASQDIDSARDRAETVLSEMVAIGFISSAERQAAQQEQLQVSHANPAGVLAYYRDWIDPLLNEVIGTQLDDFVIETTLDLQAQRAGAEAVEAVLAEQGESRRVGQAALLSLDSDGGVIAMVGGRDYNQSQFNRVTQARRQPGSSFKYFIYLAAMENGLTPWSVREDGPITIRGEGGQPDWSPGNYEDKFHGPSELAEAFQHSYNMVAVRIAHEVGRRRVIEVARRLGIASELHDYPALSLGAQEVTLLEMTQSYGAMATEGYRIEAHGVLRIRRANADETMWNWRPQRSRERVIQEQPLRYMNYMMTRVVEAGTATRARVAGRQIGGKTGTANDYRDAWFIGFTPGIVTGVWVGNDDHRIAMARVTGGQIPAEIWARFMPTALREVPIRSLQMPGPDDYDTGVRDPETPSLTAIGAPIGDTGAAQRPDDNQDRSIDFGPEG